MIECDIRESGLDPLRAPFGSTPEYGISYHKVSVHSRALPTSSRQNMAGLLIGRASRPGGPAIDGSRQRHTVPARA